MISLHLGLIVILSGLFVPGLKKVVGGNLLLIIPLVLLWLLWSLPEGYSLTFEFFNYQLQPVSIDKLSRLFATVFLIMLFSGCLFCYRQAATSELSFAYIYSGAAISVVLSKDLLSLFIFWELMAVASTFIIWCKQDQKSWAAGMRYLLVHFLGGVILMIGIILYVQETGTIAFEHIGLHSLAGYFIITGFLINAAAPPLSAWLADAYPETSFSGMVFLSAFTTKTAVYVLLRGFAGTDILIFIGVYMIFYGIIYALMENDMRRILGYSIVNQVGFMICGIGIGTEMALNGAAAHAFTHIIYKALLLMAAGAVLYRTQKRLCTDLGGLIHSMPITAVCGIIGALSISAFPYTSGFISKSMVTQSSVDQQMMIVWLLLQAASAGVFLHAGIKFPWYVFFQKDSGLRPKEAPLNMIIAMLLLSALCIGMGVFPELLYRILPYEVNYVPYTAEHVLAQLQLLLFSGLAFFVMLPFMKRTLTITLDFDWFYRKLLPSIAHLLKSAFQILTANMQPYFDNLLHKLNKNINDDTVGIYSLALPIYWTLIILSVFLLSQYL